MSRFLPFLLLFSLVLSLNVVFAQSLAEKFETAQTNNDTEAIIGTGIAYAEKLMRDQNLTKEREQVKRIFAAIEQAANSTSNPDSKAQGFLAVGKYYSRFLENYQEEALLSLDNAYQAFRQLNDQEGLAETLYTLGRFQTRVGEHQNAIAFLGDAYEIAETNNFYKLQKAISEHLSILYNLTDNIQKSDQYQNIAYNISSLQNELLAKERELEEKNRIIWALIPTVAFVVLVALLLFFGNKKISQQKEIIEKEKHTSENLLLNILPQATAEELKQHGKATPQHYEDATVMFTDFKDFTRIAEQLSPEELIVALDECFQAFDEIAERHGLERIKTIGDSYMCVGGVPTPQVGHTKQAVAAALEMQAFIQHWKAERKAQGLPFFELRLGIHTGKVVAGVVGKKKFAFDIWGDAVNLASRLESASEAGKINVSASVFEKVNSQYNFTYRGKIEVKNKGEVEMYYVESRA